MTHQQIYPYEGLFLFPQSAVADMQAASDHIREILARADATIISLFKWDERRLAYEIAGNKRGLYFLAYFKAAGDKMTEIERACNLSEQLLRALVIRADHLTDEQMANSEREQQLRDEIKLRAEPRSADDASEYIEEPQMAGEEV